MTEHYTFGCTELIKAKQLLKDEKGHLDDPPTPISLKRGARNVPVPLTDVSGIGAVEPCLPFPAKHPPAGPGWIHEIKHDGFRIMARPGRQ